ncbi:MAG: Na+/H+ antiporter NhaA [Pseudorhodobacter sp.]|nr:Na+/H+ antiporter NhaA [Pseudorhodobacter sp.]
MYRISPFISNFAWALLAGSAIATVWLNMNPAGYYDSIEARLADLPLPVWLADSQPSLTLANLTANGLMALFLFFIGKELWEALVLERRSLRGRQAATPMLALLGGLIGAALMWLGLSALFQTAEEAVPGGGWAVPLGSDVVLGYMIGRAVFGAGSPALHVLLLLSIGADIAGLLAAGLAFPANPLRLLWLMVPLLASFGVWALFCRKAHPGATEVQRRRAMQLWPYVLAGLASWVGVAASGLPMALGLLPIIPAIPHADRAFGLFAEIEEFMTDPLNRAAHLLVKPLIVVLFLFGLTRGGIDLAAWAPTTAITLGALWLGKPLGIMLGGLVLAPLLGLPLPVGLRRRDMVLIAGIAGMGFTVPVLTLGGALPGGAMQEAARLGLALSLCAGPAMIVLARAWPTSPRRQG